MGGGSNSSQSSSRPLTPGERLGAFAGGLAPLSGVSPAFDNEGRITNYDAITAGANQRLDGMKYNSPEYTSAGGPRTLGDGDYDRLEQSMLTSRTEPLKYALSQAQSGVNDDAAKRGVWSSGLAMRSENDLAARFAPQLRAAAADASTARYAAEAGDNSAVNQFNLTEAAAKNAYDMENANRRYSSQWAPANYLAGIYNGTGGAVSSGSGGGWNFSI
jgi:hypothetical protein